MQPDNEQADYLLFLLGESLPELAETDKCCVTHEVRNKVTCLRQILPLYHLRMSWRRLAVAKLKSAFGRGAELIARVKSAIAQKKPIPIPRKGRQNIRNNNILRGLVDATTTENKHVSDSKLSLLLAQVGTRRVESDTTSTIGTKHSDTVLLCRRGKSKRVSVFV